jgi:hypothetical protein
MTPAGPRYRPGPEAELADLALEVAFDEDAADVETLPVDVVEERPQRRFGAAEALPKTDVDEHLHGQVGDHIRGRRLSRRSVARHRAPQLLRCAPITV